MSLSETIGFEGFSRYARSSGSMIRYFGSSKYPRKLSIYGSLIWNFRKSPRRLRLGWKIPSKFSVVSREDS